MGISVIMRFTPLLLSLAVGEFRFGVEMPHGATCRHLAIAQSSGDVKGIERWFFPTLMYLVFQTILKRSAVPNREIYPGSSSYVAKTS